MFDDLERDRNSNNNTAYPPHNVIKIDDDNYEIQLAVAGFDKSDISVSLKDNALIVEGDKNSNVSIEFIHQGIGNRKFTKTFNLSEYIEVNGADLINGILSIHLERVVPEEQRPKVIEIGSKKRNFIRD
tara:strand:- start:4605 stop:4991 length:387 start_codon:yes stop_codon:yes gene_type:complete